MNESDAESLELFPRHEPGLHRLRRMRAGELPSPEAEQVRAHLATCPACQGRVAQLELEEAQAREAVPFARLADGVARRLLRRTSPLRHLSRVVGAMAAGAVALVAVQALRAPSRYTGVKGSSDLLLYVGGVGEPRRVQGDAELQVGERVRLQYEAGEHRYLAVLSVDERGQVTPLYPERGESQPAERGGMRMLPQSIAFDGAGRERLVAVFSDDPLPIESLVEAAHAGFTRAGSLAVMGPLGLGAEEIDRTVIKPGTP